MLDSVTKLFNVLAVITILLVQLTVLSIQFFQGQLPCPLCLLQRAALWGVAFGFLMNLRYGVRARHYGFALLSAVLTAAISIRQILLHIVPGTGQYGTPLFGLSLYTWCFFFACILIVGIALLLFFQNTDQAAQETNCPSYNRWVNVLFFLVLATICIDAGATFMECGFRSCPDNPTSYVMTHTRD